MTCRFIYPVGFDLMSVHARARLVAEAVTAMSQPDRRLSALLVELADEVELGQRTALTSKSRDAE